jgi:hypothetical protein
MQKFADQCAANLASWQNEQARLTNCTDGVAISTGDIPSPPSPRPPHEFLASFPLTLPTFALDQPDGPRVPWPTSSPKHLPSSLSSVDSNSDGQRTDTSPPDSPAPSVGSGSFVLASHTSPSLSKKDAAVAMRAAYQAGVRKKRSFYNRYSWSADLSPVASSPNLALTAVPKATAVLVTESVDMMLVSSKPDKRVSHTIATVQ